MPRLISLCWAHRPFCWFWCAAAQLSWSDCASASNCYKSAFINWIVSLVAVWSSRQLLHVFFILECALHNKLSRLVTKPTKWLCAQRRLGTAWLCTQWVGKDPRFLHADSEDSDQTGQMPSLIWVFAGRTTTLLVLSWGGSIGEVNITQFVPFVD